MTLTELIAAAGGDDAVAVDYPDITKASRIKRGGGTDIRLAVATQAVTVDDILALSMGPRGNSNPKLPVLVWVPVSAFPKREES